MSPTPSPSAPDAPRPSPDEAARALADIGRRRDQAHSSAVEARWVYVLSGVVFCALFAAPDFLGQEASRWTPAAFGALAVGYVALLNTRKGAAALGSPVRTRRQEITPRFRRYALLTLLAVLLAGFALQLLPPDRHFGVPYWRTAVGAAGGAALALFGPRCRRALLSAAVRDGRGTGRSAFHGTH
ncbi:hypothetical protein [Streptomyces sp. NPDC052496]|uniref:hypothetical protein n=1 Tax=Streptomyces sp. NPDC052496 TaxID=3154951 RepID=UPI003421B304